MYYNSDLFFNTLLSLQNNGVSGVQGSLIKHFIGQWLYDTDCFNGLHDRKLCVLGLCQLMTMPNILPPEDVAEFAPKIFPSLIMLFEGKIIFYHEQCCRGSTNGFFGAWMNSLFGRYFPFRARIMLDWKMMSSPCLWFSSNCKSIPS